MNQTANHPTTETRRLTKAHKHLYFDHKNVETLKVFINPFGQIESRWRSAGNQRKPILSAGQQKRLSAAVKRARFLALLPYVKVD